MVKLSVILVNYNGLSYLKNLFDSLKNQTYKNFEVIFVDNGSIDESVKFTKKYFPEAKVLETGANLGFTGGNNFGFKYAEGDIVILLNNDTRVEPEWAEEIVKAFEKDQNLGITTSKLTYYKKFLEVNLQTQHVDLKDLLISPKSSELGAYITNLEIEGEEYQKLIHDHEYIRFDIDKEIIIPEKYKIYVPIDLEKNQKEYKLKISAKGNIFIKNQTLRVSIDKETISEINLTSEEKVYEIILTEDFVRKKAVYVINNAGTFLDESNGWTLDLGIDEEDKGQYEDEKDLNAGCGCSLAIKRDVINQIGVLDDIYYTYFEDTDYSWRAKNKGWKIKYLPKSVVRHVHSGTSTKKNPEIFEYYRQRNRLISLLKNGRIKYALIALVKFHGLICLLILRAILSTIKNNQYKKANVSKARVSTKALLNIYLNSPRILFKRISR